MVTINTIIKEIRNIPGERLNEVYQFIHSLNIHYNINDVKRKKIISFAGLLSDMSDEDYTDFVDEIRKTRKSIPERNLEF